MNTFPVATQQNRTGALAPDGLLTLHEKPELRRIVAVERVADVVGQRDVGENLGRLGRHLIVGDVGSDARIMDTPELGVTRIGARFLDPAFELARQRAFHLPASTVRFAVAALEGRAEVLGVAALARESA